MSCWEPGTHPRTLHGPRNPESHHSGKDGVRLQPRAKSNREHGRVRAGSGQKRDETGAELWKDGGVWNVCKRDSEDGGASASRRKLQKLKHGWTRAVARAMKENKRANLRRC